MLSFFTAPELNKKTSIINTKIENAENSNNVKRDDKLKKLRGDTVTNHATVSIHNFTNTEIPPKIKKCLELGIESPIGGIPRKNSVHAKFEQFFSDWSSHALDQGLDLLKITEVKSLLFLEFLKFTNCTTPNSDTKILRDFLKQNPNLLICPVDKSKDICIYSTETYLHKLDEVFEPTKFTKISTNPLKQDLKNFMAMKVKFSKYLSRSDQLKIKPTQGLKRAYGIPKLHKNDHPVRPIISSLNSITSGAESYLHSLISPILAECTFSVNSTRTFKERLCEIKHNYNPSEHEICSFDACSLFTSINVVRTVDYITNKMYDNIEQFFPVSDDTPEPPPKILFRNFFLKVLVEFSGFESLTGFYKQKSGLSMGGKLSPSLANIFVHMLEETIVQDYIDSGVIISYQRYVDDVAIILKKGHKLELLKKFNEFDPGLKWTVENFENNKLVFLDTEITVENGTLELYQYRKPSASECLTNYKYGISPKSYKNSLITGEVYRAYNCTTSPKALDKALLNLERILKKNLYPPKLISEKISQIKNRSFKPNPNKSVRLRELKNPNLKHVTVSLPYTSFRCSTVASKIHQILKKYTPNFKLRIAFSTLKLSSIILPTLKPKKEHLLQSNIVYKFTCSCTDTYIGESERLLQTRIYEHNRTNTNVFKHITKCTTYINALNDSFGSVPSTAWLANRANKLTYDKHKREFIIPHFEILEKNLYNYYSRLTHEGLMITLHTPNLNQQQKHKSMSLVCECVKSKFTLSSQFVENSGP